MLIPIFQKKNSIFILLNFTTKNENYVTGTRSDTVILHFNV